MDVSGSSFSQSLLFARENKSPDERANLLEDFRPFLKQIAHQLIGREYSNRLDESDLVQSAIVGALNDFSACRATNELEFKAWLRKLLTHDVMNELRFLRQAKRDIGKESPISNLNELSDKQNSPSSHVVAAEDRQRLLTAISKLSNQDQEVIRYRNQDKLAFSEIGKLMSRSEDSARMLWTRAISKLAKLLKE